MGADSMRNVGQFSTPIDSVNQIKSKFRSDLDGVKKNSVDGIVFVTNQELTLSQRKNLAATCKSCAVDLFHLERITTILDKASMTGTRNQFLQIDFDGDLNLKNEMHKIKDHIEGLQTGGDAFCYWMLYHFDMEKNAANNFVIIKKGDYPLYDVRFRIVNMDTGDEKSFQWGEINAPADYKLLQWKLPSSIYYRVFFHARNGAWNQDLQLRRSDISSCWLAATRILDRSGVGVRFEHTDNEWGAEFGAPVWRS